MMTQPQPAPSSSSSSFTYTYDVFLSFRGEDTRLGYTGHLYLALCERGFVTFIDDVDLRKGEEIKPSLLSTIQKSRIAIIIFSRNYASSTFCLNELVQIFECHSNGKMRILPVYYDVDPSEVGNQTGSYGEAFAKHEQGRFKDDIDGLQKRRSALHSAANFSGYHLKGGEAEKVIIGKIIDRVSGELAGGALPSPLIQVACEKLASPQVLDFFRGRKFDESLLNNLKNKLQSIDVVAADAERKQSRDQQVKEWLLAITDMVFEVEGLLDEIDNALFECKVEAESQTSFEEEIESRMKQVLDNLQVLASHSRNLGLQAIAVRSESGIKQQQQQQSIGSESGIQLPTIQSTKARSMALPKLPPHNLELTGRVFGRQKETDHVVKYLLDLSRNTNTKTNMSIVGIVGPGGIGKTTLARVVFKDHKVRTSFQLRLWLTFPSYQLEAGTLAKVILRILKVSFKQDDQLPDLMFGLQKSLSGKSLLLVLDGCRSVHEWEKLRTCFESTARGSAIILTPRTAEDASQLLADHILRLSVLSMENCWPLFSDHCFGNQRHGCSPLLEAVGKQILSKCGGVPLAAKMLGGLLHKKDYEVWEEILRSQQWNKTDDINLLTPFLILCYLDLPIQLRRCITYLAMFPKGRKFQKSQVVPLWMAKGLIQRGSGETMGKLGNEYFDFLVARSFLIRSNSGDNMGFTMHDMVHDLVLFASAKFDSNDESIDTSFLFSNILMEENIITRSCDQQFPPTSKNDVLQTTFEAGTHFDTFRILSGQHSLRIEGCHSFESLKLKDVLKDKSTNLFELFIIDCSFHECFTDESCPTSLRTLYVHKCGKLKFLRSPEKMQNFEFLEHLFIGSSCDSLESFPMDLFPKLKILCIWDCPNLESLSCQNNNLSLESLEIRDCSNLVSFPTEGLLSPNLRSLSVSNCKKLRSLPTCMTTLTSLQSVFVVKCPELESLPAGGLPSCLKLLSIAFCDKLVPQKDWNLQMLQCLHRFEIESGCMGLKSFPEKDLLPVNLNSLYIGKLPSLEVLDHNGLQQLTALESLEINCCKKLYSLPEFLPSSLTFLCIKESSMLSQKLLNQASTDWLKIAHICSIQIDNNVISQE